MHGAAAKQDGADIGNMNEVATAFAQPMINMVIAPLLKAETDLLGDLEKVGAEWLVRRWEAVADAQRLAENIAANSEPGSILDAQREWLAGTLRRLTAEIAAWQSFTMQATRAWLPLAERSAESIAAATRAAGRPLHEAGSKG